MKAKRVVITLIVIIFILTIGNIRGLYYYLYFGNFGLNISVEYEKPYNTPSFDKDLNRSVLLLENGCSILESDEAYEGNVTYYFVDGNRKKEVCDAEFNTQIKFACKDNDLYYYTREWKLGSIVHLGFPNTQLHLSDSAYCFDVNTNEERLIYKSQKNEWILFVDDTKLIIYDSKKNDIIIYDHQLNKTNEAELPKTVPQSKRVNFIFGNDTLTVKSQSGNQELFSMTI